MKKFLLLSTVAVMITVFANATIRRVGFFGPYIAGQDYSTFALAYTAASPGDTILVFPGIVNITQTITKKLIIFSVGDYLDPTTTPPGNASLQAATGIATVNSVVFAAGSDGSLISGFYGGTYYVGASNITICRNWNLTVVLANSLATYSNLQILDNYWVWVSSGGINGSNITNMNVSNNFMYAFSTPPGNTYSGNIGYNVWAFDNTQNAGGANGGASTMSQNTSIELGLGAYLLQNNIFVNSAGTTVASNYNYFTFSNGSNSIFNYNMALETAIPINWGTGTGNVITPIANASSIFAAFPAIATSSPDARYKLGAGSPALTVGSGSKPIGMYGGTAPYKLSVIPSIPTIYKLSSLQGNNPTGTTITINVSTRGNN